MKLSVSVMPADLLGPEQLEEDPLLRMIGKGRIARRRPNAAVLFGQHVGDGEVFVSAEAPVAPRDLVQPLGKCLGQAVGKDLGHDRAIVVVVGLAAADQLVGAQAAGHGKTAHVVLPPALDRGDEIGVAVVMPCRVSLSHCCRRLCSRAFSSLRVSSS